MAGFLGSGPSALPSPAAVGWQSAPTAWYGGSVTAEAVGLYPVEDAAARHAIGGARRQQGSAHQAAGGLLSASGFGTAVAGAAALAAGRTAWLRRAGAKGSRATGLQSRGSLVPCQYRGDGWDEEARTGTTLARAPVLIDGNKVLTEDTFDVTSPATGLLVGQAPQANEGMINDALQAAAAAEVSWRRLSHAQRAAYLQKCANVMRENLLSLATLQTNESGRPLAETRIEVMVAAANFEAAGKLLNIEKVEEVISEDESKRVVVRRSPIGVVAVIAPWNAPIVLGWKPTSVALACGNTVVLKPAPQTPLTTLRIGELLGPVLPPGVLNVIVGTDDQDPRPGELLTAHPLVRKVVFTGSTAVGSKVMKACATDFKRILLELGGNDAAIIRKDTDVVEAADGVFKAAFFNNGQTCCAIKRIYCHESIFDSFVDALVARARRARLGNGLTEGVELGPLASDIQLRLVEELLEDARSQGGKVLCGGGAVAGPPGDDTSNTGLFYLPTIVTGVSEGVRLVDEEQFGPVVPVMPYRTDAEAVIRANDTPFGLGASVWGSNIVEANALADKLQAGTVWVNRHCEFIRNAPFGGIGSSGIGRAGDLGQRDLAEYTEIRTMVLAKPPPEVVAAPRVAAATPRLEVNEQGRRMLASALSRAGELFRGRGREFAWNNPTSFEDAAREAVRTFPFQPFSMRGDLQSLTEPGGPACMLMHGLPTGSERRMPPAKEVPLEWHKKKDITSETLLLGVSRLLGARTFAFEGHLNEELIQNHILCQGEETAALGWNRGGRCEPAYDPPRRFFRPEAEIADFTIVLCLKAEKKPAFLHFVDFRTLCAESPAKDLEILRSSPLSFFDCQTGVRSEPVRVVSNGSDDPDSLVVDLRQVDRYEAEGCQEAVAAYQRLSVTAERVRQTLEISEGHLAVFNNRRCSQMWAVPEDAGCLWVQTAHGKLADEDDDDEFARIVK